MMILGSSGKSGLDRLLSGRVTKDVERKASIPVVVAKAGGFKAQKKPIADLQEAYNNAR